MIGFLAPGAEAPLTQFVYLSEGPDGSAIMLSGMVALFVVCPFVAGLIHGHHWRKLMAWVAVLGSSSLALLTGQILMEDAMRSAAPDLMEAFFTATAFSLVPAIVAASAGVLLRALWTSAPAEGAGLETAQ